MANGDDTQAQQDSAPDLEIFGNKVTLHPSGYVAPAEKDREEALLTHAAKFRKAPLE
jgi:hypothetical protein